MAIGYRAQSILWYRARLPMRSTIVLVLPLQIVIRNHRNIAVRRANEGTTVGCKLTILFLFTTDCKDYSAVCIPASLQHGYLSSLRPAKLLIFSGCFCSQSGPREVMLPYKTVHLHGEAGDIVANSPL